MCEDGSVGYSVFFFYIFLLLLVFFFLSLFIYLLFFRPHCFLLNQFYFQSSQVSGVRFLFLSNFMKRE